MRAATREKIAWPWDDEKRTSSCWLPNSSSWLSRSTPGERLTIRKVTAKRRPAAKGQPRKARRQSGGQSAKDASLTVDAKRSRSNLVGEQGGCTREQRQSNSGPEPGAGAPHGLDSARPDLRCAIERSMPRKMAASTLPRKLEPLQGSNCPATGRADLHPAHGAHRAVRILVIDAIVRPAQPRLESGNWCKTA